MSGALTGVGRENGRMTERPARRGVLSGRAEDLFKLLVHRYIREGTTGRVAYPWRGTRAVP